MLASGADASRKLIAWSRQGGNSLRDQQPNPAGQKGGKAPAPAKPKEMKKSQSAPSMGASGTLGASSRRGGGWTRNEAVVDLSNYRELLDGICQSKLDLNFREKPFFRTALWEATWKNHETLVKILVAKGASVCVGDYQERTPLHEAAFYGHGYLVEFLLDNGHPIDCVDCFGQTPLHRASEAGRKDIVRLLVERGANANIIDSDKVTAQHVAAFRGMPRLANWLVFNGAVKNRFSIKEIPERKNWGTSSGSLLLSSAGETSDSKRWGNSSGALQSSAAVFLRESNTGNFRPQ